MKFRGVLAFVSAVILALHCSFPQRVCAQSNSGYALAFNGSNYVSISTTGNITGTFTVEAWVNPADTNGFSEILSTRVPGDFSFDMQLNSGVGLHGDIGNGGSWLTTAADANFAYTSNQWFHVAYVVTPTNYIIYANGQRVGSNSYIAGTPVFYNNTHSNITLGAWTPTSSLLRGQLDEVRIWNLSRTQGQILSNLTARLTGSEPGLVDYFRLDEPNTVGATTLVLDSTGRGIRGAPVNRPFRVRSTAPLSESVILNGPNPFTNDCHTAFNDPGAGTPPRAIAAKSDFCLALRTDGTVAAWGYGLNGETNVPPSLTNVEAVAVGGAHGLALKADGTVVSWGNNAYGQTNVPPNATNVVAIAGEAYDSFALKADGNVVGWGDNSYAETNIPPSATNVVAITAGGFSALALRGDGMVVGWGINTAGQITIPTGVTNVVAVEEGFNYSVALRANGTIIAWGDDSYGQTNVPPNATNVVAIAAGQSHVLALRADGTVVSWGDNSFGETNVPPNVTNVAAITAGFLNSFVLKRDGTVVGWGANTSDENSIPATVNTSAGVSTTGVVTTNAPGSYTLTYSTTTNAFGGFGTTTRTVIVADLSPAQLSLNGPNPFFLLQGTPYVEPGATATDLCAGDLSSSIVVTGSVNISVLGTNVLGYKITDPSGNTTNTVRLVVVGNKPTISGLNAFVSATNLLTETRTVTFDATVNPNTQPSGFYYMFGPTVDYLGGSIVLAIPGSLTGTNVPFPASGLSFGITFHWEVVATNYFGTTVSPDQVITVPSPFPAGDLNGDGVVSQSELTSVYSNYLASSTRLVISNVAGLGTASLTFSLGNTGISPFGVESSTNLTSWRYLGPAVSRYLIIDTNSPMGPVRFYRVRWP